jgi:propanol-preferring alcohol dehydrogenase
MVSAGTLGTVLPLTASHEGAGTVVAVGSFVTGFQKGDRVLAGLIYNRCQHCTACLGPENGHQYCQKAEGALGIRRDGSFAEYEIIDSREACILPPNLSFVSAAPLACAGSTVWKGIQRANLSPGQWLAIVGSGGGLGHLALQFAKALGLKTIGIDARDEALELGRQVGADVTIDARQETAKVIGEVIKGTEGVRADATLNLSNADSVAGLSCAVTKNHGVMIQIAQVGRSEHILSSKLTYIGF